MSVTVIAISTTGDSTLGIGKTITFTFQTDKAVTVTGMPELTLSNGAQAVYAGLDGDGNHTFTYTVVEGDTATSDLRVTGLDTTNGTVDGEASFAAQPTVGVGSRPWDIVMADVNGDGDLDILTANNQSDNVSVRLGDGHGGFSTGIDLATSMGSTVVAAGDFNGDGKLDLVAAGDYSPASVFLGNGDGTFAAATTFSLMGAVNDLQSADINSDGKLDLVSASAFGTVEVRLGDGKGGFLEMPDVDFPVNLLRLAIADFNSDGNPDFVTVGGSDTLRVQLGDGNGGFQDGGEFAVGNDPTDVVAADVNDDGSIDLININLVSKTVSVLLGDGNGGFEAAPAISFGVKPYDLAVADINGDGMLDLVTANAESHSVSVRIGDGAGGFSGGFDVGVGDGPSSIAVKDVDGDGKLDILTANRAGGNVSLLLNTTIPFSATDIGTVDGADTGRTVDATRPDAPVLDLAADTGASDSDRLTRDASLAIAMKETDATLSYSVDGGAFSSTYDPTGLADGRHTVSVKQADKTGNISDAGSVTFTLDRSAAAPTLTLTADTGASSTDKVTSNGALTIGGIEAGATLRYIVDGHDMGTTYDPTTLADGAHTVKVTQTDKAGNISAETEIGFTLDRTIEVARVTSISTDGSGRLAIGDTITFTVTTDHAVTVNGAPELTLSNGSQAAYVKTDADGKLIFAYTVVEGDSDISDLAVTGIDTTNGTIDGPGGQLSLAAQSDVSVGARPRDIVMADVNGDGNLDIITANSRDDSVSVRLGDGQGGFSAGVNLATSDTPNAVAAADFNGDGKLDIVAAGNASPASVVLGKGDGTFSAPTKVVLAGGENDVEIADINHDGHLDLLAVSTSGVLVVRLGDGDGGFTKAPDVALVTNVSRLAIADFNGDSNPDVVATDLTGGRLWVELGDGQGGFQGGGTFAVGSYPDSVVAADINGDGAIDLLSANSGSSSKSVSVLLGDGKGGFQAAPAVGFDLQPRDLAVADIDGDGKFDLVVTHSEEGKVFVKFGDGAGGFAGGAEYGVGYVSASVVVEDISGDGKSDILTANSYWGNVSVLLNTSIAAIPFSATGIGTVSGAGTGRAVDATRPDAPRVALSKDTGISDSDGLTNSATLAISGIERGATLAYSIDGGAASDRYDPAALADGEHTLSIIQIDKAGNESDATEITFTLDRTATAPVASLAYDTGASDSDQITTNGALVIGGLEQGATLSYVVDGGAASDSYDPAALAYGQHTVTVTQTDLAGNVSDAGGITFTLERPFVPPGNSTPVVADDLDDQAVIAGTSTAFTFAATAFTDADGDALTYAADNLPSWLTFNATTRTFTAAPSATDLGLFSVVVTASDGRGGLVNDTFDIVVSSPGGGVVGIDLSGTTVEENSAGGSVIGQLTARDTAESYEFTLARNPKGAFAIVDGDLVVADGARLDFETRDVYRIKVVGTDETGDRISETFTISITDVAEVIRGTPKADILLGSKGADIIRGLRSDDVLKGGGGGDRLSGGAGADTFFFSRGHDTVRDFHVDQGDVIDLRHAGGILDFQDLTANHVQETDEGLIITDDRGSTMLLRHVEMADIRADSFYF